VYYQKGKYLNAMNPNSADQNEQNVVTVRGQGRDEGIEVIFKQIAGLLARRIVFNVKAGDRVERGQRVGLIKFGSRVDVIVPVDAVLRVKVGDNVKGGATVLAEMLEATIAVPVRGSDRSASASVRPDVAESEGA
jgi:phosphatidylserine decarboxylase